MWTDTTTRRLQSYIWYHISLRDEDVRKCPCSLVFARFVNEVFAVNFERRYRGSSKWFSVMASWMRWENLRDKARRTSVDGIRWWKTVRRMEDEPLQFEEYFCAKSEEHISGAQRRRTWIINWALNEEGSQLLEYSPRYTEDKAQSIVKIWTKTKGWQDSQRKVDSNYLSHGLNLPGCRFQPEIQYGGEPWPAECRQAPHWWKRY